MRRRKISEQVSIWIVYHPIRKEIAYITDVFKVGDSLGLEYITFGNTPRIGYVPYFESLYTAYVILRCRIKIPKHLCTRIAYGECIDEKKELLKDIRKF